MIYYLFSVLRLWVSIEVMLLSLFTRRPGSPQSIILYTFMKTLDFSDGLRGEIFDLPGLQPADKSNRQSGRSEGLVYKKRPAMIGMSFAARSAGSVPGRDEELFSPDKFFDRITIENVPKPEGLRHRSPQEK